MTRLAFAIVSLLVSPAVAGTIIHVPSEAQTIQIAILKAQPFDTIIVAPGTYSEAINYMGKVIIVQSENPNDPATVAGTIIDAGGLGTVVTLAVLRKWMPDPPGISTLRRWCTPGVRGVRLRACQSEGRWHSTLEAVERFRATVALIDERDACSLPALPN